MAKKARNFRIFKTIFFKINCLCQNARPILYFLNFINFGLRKISDSFGCFVADKNINLFDFFG
jgi:hypothetical protein